MDGSRQGPRRTVGSAIRPHEGSGAAAGGGGAADEGGVGGRLRRLREERGLTQSELAGGRLTKSFISQLERGRSRASQETVEYLAERLGVSFLALMPDLMAGQEKEYLFRAASASILGRSTAEAEEFLVRLDPLLTGPRERAHAGRLRAELLEARGWLDEALDEALCAYEQAVTAPHPEEITRTSNLVVRLHFRAARFPAALIYNQRSIAAAADASVPAGLRAMVLNNGGQIHFALGDSRKALEYFRRAADAAEEAEDLQQLGHAALGAGEAARRLGDVATAIAQAERAQVVFERLEMRHQLTRIQLNLADIYLDMKDYGRALEFAQRARDAAPLTRDVTTEALAAERLAHIAAAEGRGDDATRLAQEAIHAAIQAGDTSFLALARASLGEACGLAGDAQGADEAFAEALAVLDRSGTSPEMSPSVARREVLLRYGKVLRARGDLTAALDCLERAARLTG